MANSNLMAFILDPPPQVDCRRMLPSIMNRMNPARDARLAIRRGAHRMHTAGLAPGYVQGNLCIVPKQHAADFRRFCELNPKPCPLLGISAPGEPHIPE